MIVELHNDDGTKTTYFGVSDFNQHDNPEQRVTNVFLNNDIEADYDELEFFHYDAEIHSVISEAVCDQPSIVDHIGSMLVEPGHEIIVGIPAMRASVAYGLAELRRDPTIDAEDNLTIVGRPDPEFPDNDTSEVES